MERNGRFSGLRFIHRWVKSLQVSVCSTVFRSAFTERGRARDPTAASLGNKRGQEVVGFPWKQKTTWCIFYFSANNKNVSLTIFILHCDDISPRKIKISAHFTKKKHYKKLLKYLRGVSKSSMNKKIDRQIDILTVFWFIKMIYTCNFQNNILLKIKTSKQRFDAILFPTFKYKITFMNTCVSLSILDVDCIGRSLQANPAPNVSFGNKLTRIMN